MTNTADRQRLCSLTKNATPQLLPVGGNCLHIHNFFNSSVLIMHRSHHNNEVFSF